MGFSRGPVIPKLENLTFGFKTVLYNGTSSQTIPNHGDSNATITLSNYSSGTSLGIPTIQSNTAGDGSGTSQFRISNGSSKIQTGSITILIWFNLEGISINVGGNNNWRSLLQTTNGTAGYPVTMVLEQSNAVNISTGHTDGYRRYLNNSFTPYSVTTNGWQMLTYTYEQSSGNAAVYKNGSSVRTGPMTTNTSNGSPTIAGDALSYSNYSSGGFGISGTNTGANPSGNGTIPGELGTVMFWNTALTSDEIATVYNVTKGQYGL